MKLNRTKKERKHSLTFEIRQNVENKSERRGVISTPKKKLYKNILRL
jgi:hypothetical protein